MEDEPEITQVEEVPSQTPSLYKTLNSKRHNNVEAKNKDGQRNKKKDSLKKKDKGSRKRKYSTSSDESNSDCDEDSSEGSDMQEMSQDEHPSSRFSTKSSTKKNKWRFS